MTVESKTLVDHEGMSAYSAHCDILRSIKILYSHRNG